MDCLPIPNADNWIHFGNGMGSWLPLGNMVSIAPYTLGCSQSHSPPLRGGDFHDAEARRSPTVSGLAWRRQPGASCISWEACSRDAAITYLPVESGATPRVGTTRSMSYSFALYLRWLGPGRKASYIITR